jgi:enterochelin esterase family protein
LFETAVETDFGDVQDFLAASQHMRDVLRAKGYEVQYQEFSTGHNALNWQGTLATGLLALLGRGRERKE